MRTKIIGIFILISAFVSAQTNSIDSISGADVNQLSNRKHELSLKDKR